jgi:hypothetical protein
VVSGPGARTAAVAATLAIGASACALIGRAGGRGDDGGDGGAADVRIVLYRDRALVDEQVEAVVRDGKAELPLPAGVAADQLMVLSPDVHVRAWAASAADGQRDVTAAAGARTWSGRLLGVDETGVVLADGDDVHVLGGAESLAGRVRPALVAAVDGRSGRARFRLRYPTDRLRWQASYALVDRQGRGRLRGALTVDNQTGRSWRRAALSIIDAAPPEPAAADAVLPALARLPGRYAIDVGRQRLELALRDRALAVRSTMVYDPIGAALDHTGNPPERDPSYGVKKWPSALEETVKVDLAEVADVQLPAGPVRLASIEPDGALRWRGEGALLPPSAHAERYLTVPIGRIDDVTGVRRRTDFVVDAARERAFEQIEVTLTSTRTRPVEVLVREHIYRGPCWTLVYHSTGDAVAQEADQQIALTTIVPAGGSATVAYRVVYYWSKEQCTEHSPSKS